MALQSNSDLVARTFVLLSLLAIAAHQFQATHKSSQPAAAATATMAKLEQQLFTCNFEVFGLVQGVFFRKYTERKANSLGVRGWCMNTREGTVKGQLEAPLPQLNEMKHWLETKGSPQSVIEKVEFTPIQEIESYSFKDFTIHR